MVVAAALAVGCGGGDGGEGIDEPADAGAVVDAGKVDAGAAPVVGAGRVAACAPDAGVGAETTSTCWTRAELADRGCSPAWVGTSAPGSGTTTTVQPGAVAAVDAARWVLLYTVPGEITVYLCSSTAPATDWRCSSQPLANCRGGTCSTVVTVPALPTVHAICAREPT